MCICALQVSRSNAKCARNKLGAYYKGARGRSKAANHTRERKRLTFTYPRRIIGVLRRRLAASLRRKIDETKGMEECEDLTETMERNKN
jgi:hypothetical protein